LTGKVVLVLGSEGKGLRPRVAESCDLLVSIPVRGRVASLNVSAAAAVLLFEAVRQRGRV
jgi:23S rRNA (guanosine2251-2'-O)-methyltransferase